jgi:cytochrome c peroxidase
VPRNPAIPANANTRFFDLGLCGPLRVDLRVERRYCGYFKTPSLRNVARRRFYFHNGRFTNLAEVIHFYAERDTAAQRWYPTIAGIVRKFDDLPAQYRPNVNVSDAPLNRGKDDPPAMDDTDVRALVAFLQTLSDAD